MFSQTFTFAALIGIITASQDTVVVIANSSLITQCNKGLIVTQDRIILIGRVNVTGVTFADRQYLFLQNRFKTDAANKYNQLYRIDISKPCGPDQNSVCTCIANSSSFIEVLVNITANLSLSEQLVRFYWPGADPLDPPDYSSDFALPTVYSDIVQNLKINNKDVDLYTCNSELISDNENLIKYCVTGLSSHNLILNFSSLTPIQSPDECVNTTYILSDTVNESSPIIFSVSYLEHDGCRRTQSKECYLYNLPTTTATTLNTTFEKPRRNENISNVLTGLLSAHVVCTVAVIVISITALAIIFQTVLRQQDHTNSRPLHLDLLCIIITLFEISQIILVIIAGAQFFGEGRTTLYIWEIMIIYQVLVNGIFVIIESIILGIKTNSNGFQVGSQTFLYIITLICIHTVIGIIAVPFLWHFLGSAGLSKESNHPVHGNNDSVHYNNHNKKKKKSQTDAIFNNKINANVSAQENAQQESDQSGPKKVKKKAKQGRKEHFEKEADTKENNKELNATRVGTASKIKLIDETNQALELRDLSIPSKRPTSIEETNNPNLVGPRKLPPLNKK